MTLRRTAFLRKTPDAARLTVTVTTLRSRKCRICFNRFTPNRKNVTWCGPECGVLVAKEAVAKQERAADRVKRESLKTRQDHLKDAQVAFNAFIRARDADQPCISCGRHHQGAFDAGHYRSVGAQPALRFDETNCHKQCVPCNQHRAGNIVEYRIRLLQKIGREAVELLEIEHEPTKYTIEEAQFIKQLYRAKLKALTNSRSGA